MSEATLHSVAGPRGIGDAAGLAARHPVLVGPFDRLVARVSPPGALLDEAARGLPEGAARAEALAVRLRRAGVELAWGEPDELASPRELLELCRARGRSSVEIWRADPTLLTELQLGARTQAGTAHRFARRLPLPRRSLRRLRASAERAFWAGAREAATPREWDQLNASYAALVYHRLAGDRKPGQERVDLHPRRFARQLRVLDLLGFRPLSPEELLSFHDGDGSMPSRAFVITVDDGTEDAGGPLTAQAASTPQLFVCTQEVGGSAAWLDGEPLLSWESLELLERRGVAVGAHGRTHRPLDSLAGAELESELRGSLADLGNRLPDAIPLLAYPNGRHDHAVRAAAVSAGFRAAWTTEKGRNGLGTDPWCLRRVSVHAADGPLSVLWKVVTGEPPPWRRR